MLRRRTATEDPRPGESPSRRDCGGSFLEVLVAVVLLGTAVLGVLAALRVSVIGSRLERDHAKAYQWLQSADGVLQAAPRISCLGGEEAVRLGYQDRIRTDVVNPPDWADSQITITAPVKVWDGSQYWDPAASPKECYDDDGFLLQLIELQVTSPDGDIIESIQVVKRD